MNHTNALYSKLTSYMFKGRLERFQNGNPRAPKQKRTQKIANFVANVMCFRQHCAILWLVYILSISSLVVGGRATLLKFVRFHQREFNRHHVDPEVHMNVVNTKSQHALTTLDYLCQIMDIYSQYPYYRPLNSNEILL